MEGGPRDDLRTDGDRDEDEDEDGVEKGGTRAHPTGSGWKALLGGKKGNDETEDGGKDGGPDAPASGTGTSVSTSMQCISGTTSSDDAEAAAVGIGSESENTVGHLAGRPPPLQLSIRRTGAPTVIGASSSPRPSTGFESRLGSESEAGESGGSSNADSSSGHGIKASQAPRGITIGSPRASQGHAGLQANAGGGGGASPRVSAVTEGSTGRRVSAGDGGPTGNRTRRLEWGRLAARAAQGDDDDDDDGIPGVFASMKG